MCCYFAAHFLTFVLSGAWWRGQRGGGDDEGAGAVGECGGEDAEVASLVDAETGGEGGDGEGEVAGGEVGFGVVGAELADGLFVEGVDGLYAECVAGEAGWDGGGGEEVGVGMEG